MNAAEGAGAALFTAFARSGTHRIQGRSPDSQPTPQGQRHGSSDQPDLAELATYSGGTVRDSHPLPFSFADAANTLNMSIVAHSAGLTDRAITNI